MPHRIIEMATNKKLYNGNQKLLLAALMWHLYAVNMIMCFITKSTLGHTQFYCVSLNINFNCREFSSPHSFEYTFSTHKHTPILDCLRIFISHELGIIFSIHMPHSRTVCNKYQDHHHHHEKVS